MALYSYTCLRCGYNQEMTFIMGDAPEHVRCEKCRSNCKRDYKCNIMVPNPTHEARKNRGKGR